MNRAVPWQSSAKRGRRRRTLTERFILGLVSGEEAGEPWCTLEPQESTLEGGPTFCTCHTGPSLAEVGPGGEARTWERKIWLPGEAS